MQDVSPWPAGSFSGFDRPMFVAEETSLPVSFGTARNRLARSIREGTLLATSREAYEKQGGQLTRVGPFGSTSGLSRLVEVQLGDLVTHDTSVVVAVRWRATGRGRGLFPTLDADLGLAPEDESASVLKLAGVYRPPLGPVGAGMDQVLLNRVATATVQAFLRGLAGTIAREPSTVGTDS
jgi:hypothetical protein